MRRLVGARVLTGDIATLALADVADLAIQLFDFAPYADRGWELRATVTAYDAWYVALAESLDVPFATLDRRLRKAGGPRCRFAAPEGAS